MRVERLELAGEGLLRAQVEELRGRLAAEGLLDPARKRRPPLLPRRIGLVTSADGAARQDVLTNVWARLPEADVVVVGVPVQGDDAPRLIARALRHLDARAGGRRDRGGPRRRVARGPDGLQQRAGLPRRGRRRRRRSSRPWATSATSRCATSWPTCASPRPRPRRRRSCRAGRPSRPTSPTPRRRSARGLLRGPRGRRGGAAGPVRRPGAGAAGPRRARARPRRAPRAPPRAGPAARPRSAAAARADRAEAMLAVLSPRRTVARGYAIVREAEGGRVVADAAGVGPGRELSIELRDGRLAATATGTGAVTRRGPGRRPADLRGGPAPPRRGRRPPRGGRGGPRGGGGALRAGAGAIWPRAASGWRPLSGGSRSSRPRTCPPRPASRRPGSPSRRSEPCLGRMRAGRSSARGGRCRARCGSRGTWQPALPTLA